MGIFNLRLAAGYAFGKVDDHDFDGTRSAGGPYLGLTLKLNELFNGFGLQKVAPRQQRESRVKSLVQELLSSKTAEKQNNE